MSVTLLANQCTKQYTGGPCLIFSTSLQPAFVLGATGRRTMTSSGQASMYLTAVTVQRKHVKRRCIATWIKSELPDVVCNKTHLIHGSTGSRQLLM